MQSRFAEADWGKPVTQKIRRRTCRYSSKSAVELCVSNGIDAGTNGTQNVVHPARACSTMFTNIKLAPHNGSVTPVTKPRGGAGSSILSNWQATLPPMSQLPGGNSMASEAEALA